MLTEQMKQQVADKVAELVNIANVRYNRTMFNPPIFWDCNDTKGGYHLTGTLHFNPTLTAQNFEHYLTSTVPHEVAHFVQWIIYPHTLQRRIVYRGYRPTYSRRQVHGREWESIMRVFGIRDPQRCHDYDTTSVKKVFKKVPVYCMCSTHQVTNRIIVKMQAGKSYKCPKCKSRVSLTNPLTPAAIPVLSLV